MQKNWTINKQNLYQEVTNLLQQSLNDLDIENQKEILMLLEEKSLKILVK
jgi:predicted transcriptional regulator